MELTDFPKSFQPIVQPIDTWFINRKLGMLFEAKAGTEKLWYAVPILKTISKKDGSPTASLFHFEIHELALVSPENDIDLSLIENLYTKQGERLEVKTLDAPMN
jgi:hypothetical protein